MPRLPNLAVKVVRGSLPMERMRSQRSTATGTSTRRRWRQQLAARTRWRRGFARVRRRLRRSKQGLYRPRGTSGGARGRDRAAAGASRAMREVGDEGVPLTRGAEGSAAQARAGRRGP